MASKVLKAATVAAAASLSVILMASPALAGEVTTQDTCTSENRIENVRSAGFVEIFPSGYPWSVSADSPSVGSATLLLSHSTSVANKWSANVTLTAKAVSAAVGYDVTTTTTATTSYSVSMPAKTGRWTVYAGHRDRFSTFDVYRWSRCTPGGSGWQRGSKVGMGTANKFNNFVYGSYHR